MTNVIQTKRSYPKRKRAEVSYYESLSDASEAEASASEASQALEVDSDDSEIEEQPAAKVSKFLSPYTPIKAKNLPQRIKREATPQPPPAPKPFPFAKLPAELRNKIYFYALTSPSEILLMSNWRNNRRSVQLASNQAISVSRIRRHREYKPKELVKPSLSPGFLYMNKRFYAEAQPILYGANTFALDDTTALHLFCLLIGDENCRSLRNVSLKEWGERGAQKTMNNPAFGSLSKATNLESVRIDCNIHSAGSDAIYVARHFYREAQPFLWNYGMANGGKFAALDIVKIKEENFEFGPRSYYSRPREHQTLAESLKLFRAELKNLLKQ